ncbi:MAG: PH domain-containing protein [Bacteroidota bacterium]
MESFQSSKHFLFQILLLITPVGGIIFTLWATIDIIPDFELSWTYAFASISILLTLIVCWLMIDAYRNTVYIIDGNYLVYQISFWKKTIPISDIWLIKASTYPSAGYRPALDWNGLKIVYGKDRVVFVSPASQSKFIASLKRKNEAIEVML